MIDTILSTMNNEEQRNELAEFYSKYKERFCNIAYSKLKNHYEAEDVVQEVFSEIADKPEKFFDVAPQNRLTYTSIMVRNIAFEMFKSKNKVEFMELSEEIEDTGISLEDNLFAEITHSEIVAFMKQLPTEQKSVLQLHCYLGLTLYETSQRLHISLTTANRRLMLARKAIKNFIDERNVDYE